MKKVGKKTVALILALTMAMSLMSVTAWARYGSDADDDEGIQTLSARSGTFGTNLQYELDENGVLTISVVDGATSGTMDNYTEESPSPFADADDINYIIIEEGCTNIGDYAFAGCRYISFVLIPASVRSIGEWAFKDNKVYTTLTLVFMGDAPYLSDSCFWQHELIVYYPMNTEGWLAYEYWDEVGKAISAIWYLYDPATIAGESELTYAFSDGLLTISGSGTVARGDLYTYLTSVGVDGSAVEGIEIDNSSGNITISYSAFTDCRKGIKAFIFIGDPPTFEPYCMRLISAQAYYPGYVSSWTSAVRSNYGGALTWIDYETAGRREEKTIRWYDYDDDYTKAIWNIYDLSGNNIFSRFRTSGEWYAAGYHTGAKSGYHDLSDLYTWTIDIDEFVKEEMQSDAYDFKYATVTDPNIGNDKAEEMEYDGNPYGYAQFGSSEDPVKTIKISGYYGKSTSTKTWVYTIICQDGAVYTLEQYGNYDYSGENYNELDGMQDGYWCPYDLNINFYFGEAGVCTHENVEHVTAKAATCTSTGNSEYWYCPDCNKYFLDSSCTNETTQSDVTVSALGHVYSSDAVSFEWSDSGHEVYANDITCKATFACTACQAESTVKAAVTYTEWDATCTTPGEEDFTAVATIDSRGTVVTATAKDTFTIGALGHDWDAVFTWTDDYASATATRTCSRCGIGETAAAVAVESETTVPTCTENGQTVHTASVTFENGDTKTDEIILSVAALGHVYDAEHVSDQWNADAADPESVSCTFLFTCLDCEETESVVGQAQADPENGWDATCTRSGMVHFTATGSITSRGGEIITVSDDTARMTAALGHAWVAVETVPATYEDVGSVTYECSRCGETGMEVIEKLTPYFDVMNETPSEYVTAAIGDDVDLDAHYELDVTVLNAEDLDEGLIAEVETAALAAVTEMIENGAIESGDYELSEPFWLDIDLLKWLDSEYYEPIDESWFEITITVPIPEELLGADDYILVRMHDGAAEVLEAATDEENVTVTFTTDRFSVYALYALNEAENSGVEDNTGTEDDDNTDPTIPDADDDEDDDGTGEDLGSTDEGNIEEPGSTDESDTGAAEDTDDTGEEGDTDDTETDNTGASGDTDSTDDTGSTGNTGGIGSDEDENPTSGNPADKDDADETDATPKNGGNNPTGSGSTVVVGEDEDEDADETADEDDSGKDNPKTDDTQMPYLMLTIFLLAICGFAVMFVCDRRRRSCRRR